MRVTPNGISTSSDKSYDSFQIGAGITMNLERRGDIVEATLSGFINSPVSSNTKLQLERFLLDIDLIEPHILWYI
ncbi:hypothetical protein ICE98_00878 [Lactococcus lactis]|nr:hypothetical protein [Lactococcus lactis]